MTATIAPCRTPHDYASPRIDKIKSTPGCGKHPLWHPPGSLPAITSSHTEAWRELEILLTGIITLSKRNYSPAYGLPARLEFVRDETNKGVVIFDSHGRLIVHVVHASLGELGPGPELSWKLMTFLGVSHEMAHDIVEAIEHRPMMPYLVVLSREAHTTVGGVKTAAISPDVKADWDWWPVR